MGDRVAIAFAIAIWIVGAAPAAAGPAQTAPRDTSGSAARTGAPLSAADAERFARSYAAAWKSKDPGAALGALWHPDGVLYDPLYDRNLAGREIAALTKGQIARNPELTWTLLGWTYHNDVVVLEWQNNFKVNGRPFEWRGVDKMRLRNGLIIEETVYMDTAPLRAARAGNPHEPVVRLPPLAPAKPN